MEFIDLLIAIMCTEFIVAAVWLSWMALEDALEGKNPYVRRRSLVSRTCQKCKKRILPFEQSDHMTWPGAGLQHRQHIYSCERLVISERVRIGKMASRAKYHIVAVIDYLNGWYEKIPL